MLKVDVDHKNFRGKVLCSAGLGKGYTERADAQNQKYAKEMFDYTGYENQVKQMKAAGLNPALLNGGSGSAGQAHGATVNPATAMQPMGLQV